MSVATPPFVLPAAVVSRTDLMRLVRELESVDNELESQKARHEGEDGKYHMPSMSSSLSEFLESNKLDISHDHARMDLKAQLRKLKDHAPIMHMTFATEADPEALRSIVAWIRKELHPQTLISVGLQPNLIAGVYVRTPNHVHDMSVRAHMKDSRHLIVEALDALKEPVAQ